MEDQDGQGARPTGFAITVVVVLVIGLAALFIPSSHTIQVIGFAIVTIVAIVCLIEFRPKRPGGRRIPLRMRTNYLPGTGRMVRPEWSEDPGPGEEPEPESRRPRPGRGA
jgi:membrane protein implicated in regulation of membrane protease activity